MDSRAEGLVGSDLSKDERSILLYAESCIVDGGGLLENRRMNANDHDALNRFMEIGVLTWGRIPFKLIDACTFTQSQPTHWVEFTPLAWVLAHQLRQLRAEQRGPFATSVFEAIAEKVSA